MIQVLNKGVINEGESYIFIENAWADFKAFADQQIAEAKEAGSDVGFDNFAIKAYSVSAQTPVVELGTPTNVKAKGVKKAIKVSWDPVEGADGYCIHYGTKKSNLEGELDVKDTGAKINKLKKNKKYFLTVHAVKLDEQGNVIAESEPSTVIKVKTQK